MKVFFLKFPWPRHLFFDNRKVTKAVNVFTKMRHLTKSTDELVPNPGPIAPVLEVHLTIES